MAGPYQVGFNPDAPAGSKFDPEVIAEIAEVAPSTVTPGSIETSDLAQKAVTTDKLDDEAVGTDQLGDGSVTYPKLGPKAVKAGTLDDDSVTVRSAGTGVLTLVDNVGAPIGGPGVLLTDAQYAALGTPDPNTLYFTH